MRGRVFQQLLRQHGQAEENITDKMLWRGLHWR